MLQMGLRPPPNINPVTIRDTDGTPSRRPRYINTGLDGRQNHHCVKNFQASFPKRTNEGLCASGYAVKAMTTSSRLIGGKRKRLGNKVVYDRE